MMGNSGIMEKVKKYVEKHHMLNKGSKVVMGISGGADSVAMLLVLAAFREVYDISLFAVHINHGIRKEAVEDAEFVRELCEKHEIPFFLYEANIPQMAKEQKKTEEEMGREYRLQCFAQVAGKTGADTLAVAHHMGDQAETVLFHMVRGTDLSGLMGISPVNEMRIGNQTFRMIRPLLCCEKKELIDWLISSKVDWKEDCTNQQNIYARNKLRNEIVPLMEEINEKAMSHIANLADMAGEYYSFFNHLVEEYIGQHVLIMKDRVETDRNRLVEKEPVFARAVIYEMIAKVCDGKKDLRREHVQSVYELLINQTGKKVMLPYQAEAAISYEKLIIRKCLTCDTKTEWKQVVAIQNYLFENGTEEQEVFLPFGGRVVLKIENIGVMTQEEKKHYLVNIINSKNNYTKFFDCDTIKDTLHIRTVEQEDSFIMNQNGSRKKVSRYFIDRKIPMDRRQYTMVLAMEHEILWILGERRSEGFKVNENTKYLLKVTYEGENDG